MQQTDSKPTVLIVEDDPHMVNLLTIVLKKSNIQVDSAHDGKEALDFLSRETPSLIISDIMMPNMDGYTLRKELLKRDETKLIPFMFLSAKGNAEDIVEGMNLNADDYIPKPFDPEVLLARVNSIIRRYSHFNELIRYDPLTQVYNRRTLYSNLTSELRRVKRYQHPLSIFMIDLDHFKDVNDNYGHSFGDKVLKMITACLKDHLRETDFIGRVGGEEFVVVLPNTSKKIGAMVADRLRERISQIQFEIDGFAITISGGVSAAPDDGMEIDVLMKKADAAMYAAKGKGRNQITCVESA